jgi:hypothetical protein
LDYSRKRIGIDRFNDKLCGHVRDERYSVLPNHLTVIGAMDADVVAEDLEPGIDSDENCCFAKSRAVLLLT